MEGEKWENLRKEQINEIKKTVNQKVMKLERA